MVTSTMTSLSSCWTLSFFSLVSVSTFVCVLGLTTFGSARNTGRQLHIHMFCCSSHFVFVAAVCNDP